MSKPHSWLRRLTIISALALGGIFVLYSAGMILMPSSKSARIDWEQFKKDQAAEIAADQTTQPAESSKALMWGSKSGRIVSPPTDQQIAPSTAPTGRMLMPSSKSAPIFVKENVEENTASTAATQPSTLPVDRTFMGGSKSFIIFKPESDQSPSTQPTTQPQ